MRWLVRQSPLPQSRGVNHFGGAGSYTWRTSESYKVVDYVISQYNYNAT
jgi:hypothetical protein